MYLHRWITEASEDEHVQFRTSTLEGRRSNLEVTRRHRSYRRQIARCATQSERQQYTKALAKQLLKRSALPVAFLLRGLQRDSLPPALEEAASRVAGERLGSLPPLRVRAGWEHRLPTILEDLKRSPAELMFRRHVETLFQVSCQTAVRILDQFGASFYGTALAIERLILLERLREVEVDPAVLFECERRSSVFRAVTRDELGEALGVVAQQLAGNRAYLEGAAAQAYRQSRLASFPERFQLSKTELRMQFQGFTEFLQQIGVIVYALHNDAEALEAILT